MRPPSRKVIMASSATLAVYTAVLAGFEIATGAGPGSWGVTLIGAVGFLGATLAAKREYA